MKSRSKGGRPASYTAGQLDEAITTAEDREPKVTWEHVRAVLIEEHGVSPTIRGESLQKVVEPLLMKRQRTREDALISRVPEGTQTAIADAVTAMERLMSLTPPTPPGATRKLASGSNSSAAWSNWKSSATRRSRR